MVDAILRQLCFGHACHQELVQRTVDRFLNGVPGSLLQEEYEARYPHRVAKQLWGNIWGLEDPTAATSFAMTRLVQNTSKRLHELVTRPPTSVIH